MCVLLSDSLEESLALAVPETNHQSPKPVLAPKAKKATRRKGQPRKYERYTARPKQGMSHDIRGLASADGRALTH